MPRGRPKSTTPPKPKPEKILKPYCGCDDIPKNKRHGSMEECLKMKKVGLYGIKKIDSRLLNGYKTEVNNKENLRQENFALMSLLGRVNKIKKDFPYLKTDEEKLKMKKEYKTLRNKKVDILNKINKLENLKKNFNFI